MTKAFAGPEAATAGHSPRRSLTLLAVAWLILVDPSAFARAVAPARLGVLSTHHQVISPDHLKGNARTMDTRLKMDSVAGSRVILSGFVGQRVKANIDGWLLQAPQQNPGMLEMFRQRERYPVPLDPWAGEFAGKYLISAVQAIRMTEDASLKSYVGHFVDELLATQDTDGYFGPFPHSMRFKNNWDLWGQYHILEALLLWYQDTGDRRALLAGQKLAELVYQTFPAAGKPIREASSEEMNMAIMAGIGHLYRLTGDPHCLATIRAIEADWDHAGDYLRTGLRGLEFFQIPRPRWESLHDLQGLVELCRITGDDQYLTAFEHHWRSIRRWDRRNTGGFSSAEQATGDPYAPTPIETCSSVAWIAITLDMLRLTGSSQVADELELTTLNSALGWQEPSGHWCTYNTPMDGTRVPSFKDIAFQARPWAPGLNCCAVNGPRGLGMLSEWAVMSIPNVLVVNYDGPGTFHGTLDGGQAVWLEWVTGYPVTGHIQLHLASEKTQPFDLWLRIPAWSLHSSARLNGAPLHGITAGSYLKISRSWSRGDKIDLNLDMSLRAVPGDRACTGKVSLYRGPILLAYDEHENPARKGIIPEPDLEHVSKSAIRDSTVPKGSPPWLRIDIPGIDGGSIHLCDFASSGAAGSAYHSWLPAHALPPPPVVTVLPADGAAVPPDTSLFRWTGPEQIGPALTEYRLTVAVDPGFHHPALEVDAIHTSQYNLSDEKMRKLPIHQWYYWKIVAVNAYGATSSVEPAARFYLTPIEGLDRSSVPGQPTGRIPSG